MSETSEEKQAAASDKKLRDSRTKGRTSQSRDFISGFIFIIVCGYLYYIYPYIQDRIYILYTILNTEGETFISRSSRAIYSAFALMMLINGPLAIVVLASTILFGIISTYGPVFSFETIKPQFDHISPSKGLKRIFGLRNIIELFKGLVKITFISFLFSLFLILWIKALFLTPSCGQSCIGPVAKSMLGWFCIVAAIGFVIVGLIDLPLQRWLFLREMRMTKTEVKREHKDMEGDPLIRQRLRSQRRELVMSEDIRSATPTVVFTWKERLVAILYIPGKMSTPVVVEKSDGSTATQYLNKWRHTKIPVVNEERLIEIMFKQSVKGMPIPPNSYDMVALHIFRLGLD